MRSLFSKYLGVTMVLLIAATKFAYAQWSFRETIHLSGRCDGIDHSIVNSINGQIPEITGFATRAECEAARAYINSIRSSYGGCTAYASASPCVGHDIGGGSVAGIANPTVGASSQGSSFFYTSVPEEVKNWQAEQDRIDALIGNRSDNPVIGLASTSDAAYNASINEVISRYSSGPSSFGTGGNGVFVSSSSIPLQPIYNDANLQIVLDYLSKLDSDFYYSLLMNPSNLNSLLRDKFKEVTQKEGTAGIDIDAILKKSQSQWSKEEKQIVSNYNEFVRLALKEAIGVSEQKIREKDSDKGKRLVDAAITSALSYNKEEYDAYYKQTDYRPIDRSLIDQNDVINVLIDALDYCNSTEGDTGFHAELYKNDITGEYMLAFQGSTDPSDFLSLDLGTLKGAIADWLHNNVPNGLNDFFSEDSNVGNFIKKTYENTFGGFDKPQFMMAASLAMALDYIGDKADINISGHSLGGGLAGYVGLLTDRQTYMFNPEGLGQDLIQGREIGNNFHVVITEGEPLTGMQEFGESLKRAMNNNDSEVFMVVPGKTSDSKVSNPNSKSHSIEDLVDYQLTTTPAQREWEDLRAAQLSLEFLAQPDSGIYIKEDSLLLIEVN